MHAMKKMIASLSLVVMVVCFSFVPLGTQAISFSLTPLRLMTTQSTLDATSFIGYDTSVAIDTYGNPVISYYDAATLGGVLRLYLCDDVACLAGTSRLLDADGLGGSSDVVIDPDGYPVISYYDSRNSALKFYHCANKSCSTGQARTLDDSDSVGMYTAITIGTDGYPVISYMDLTNYDLKFYDCDDAECSTGIARTLDNSVNRVGYETDIIIGRSGYPIIAYHDNTEVELKLFFCSDTTCSAGTIQTLGHTGGYNPALAINSSGYPVIAYYYDAGRSLGLYTCSDILCSAGSSQLLDSTDDVGQDPAVVLDNDQAVISYYDETNGNLKLIRCLDTSCASRRTYIMQSTNDVGRATSIAMSSDGYPIIAYRDNTTGYLNTTKFYNYGINLQR